MAYLRCLPMLPVYHLVTLEQKGLRWGDLGLISDVILNVCLLHGCVIAANVETRTVTVNVLFTIK